MSFTYLYDSLCDYKKVLEEVQGIETTQQKQLTHTQPGTLESKGDFRGKYEHILLYGVPTQHLEKIENKKWHYDCPTLKSWFEVHSPFSRLDTIWFTATSPQSEIPWHRDVLRDCVCHIPLDTNDEWFLEIEGGQKIKAKNGLPFIFDAQNNLHRGVNPSLTHTRIHITSFGILREDLRKSLTVVKS